MLNVSHVCVTDGCVRPRKSYVTKLGKVAYMANCAVCLRHIGEERFGVTEPYPVGYRKVDATGYARVKTEDGWQAEHRVVMERELGRPLRQGESVHHMNGVRSDNRPENLELWTVAQRSGVRGRDITCPHCGKRYDPE